MPKAALQAPVARRGPRRSSCVQDSGSSQNFVRIGVSWWLTRSRPSSRCRRPPRLRRSASAGSSSGSLEGLSVDPVRRDESTGTSAGTGRRRGAAGRSGLARPCARRRRRRRSGAVHPRRWRAAARGPRSRRRADALVGPAVGEPGEHPGDLLEGATLSAPRVGFDGLPGPQVVDQLGGGLGVWLSKNSQLTITTGAKSQAALHSTRSRVIRRRRSSRRGRRRGGR